MQPIVVYLQIFLPGRHMFGWCCNWGVNIFVYQGQINAFFSDFAQILQICCITRRETKQIYTEHYQCYIHFSVWCVDQCR